MRSNQNLNAINMDSESDRNSWQKSN